MILFSASSFLAPIPSAVWGGIVAAIVTVVVATITNRTQRKTADKAHVIDSGKLELDARRLDGEVFERAEKFNAETIANLRTDMERIRTDRETDRTDAARKAAEQDARATEQDAHIARLEQRIQVLTAIISDAGLQVPPLPA